MEKRERARIWLWFGTVPRTNRFFCGSSLAGGLRSYVLDRLYGYATEETKLAQKVANVFGGTRGNDEGGQSPLIVFDSVCQQKDWVPEIRDGVAIETGTGLAEDHKKFDFELLPPGTIVSNPI